jgi:4,5-dihydroxyphthalate decarboxylase
MSDQTMLQALIGKYPNSAALHDGSIRSDRLRLEFADVFPVHNAFGRMVREQAFDVSEMAIVTYLQAKAAGAPLTLLPIVMIGRFQHKFLMADAGRPVTPEQLIGARVGVRAYTVTTGAWLRGLLEFDYGVPSDSVTWVTFEDSHVADFVEPSNVERAPVGKTIEQMLMDGELDAAVLGSPGAPAGPGATVPVIADPLTAAGEWFAKYGIVPINHLLVVPDRLSEQSPELVAEVFDMVKRARAIGLDDARLAPAEPGVTAADALPLGIDALRPGLELISEYAAKQHLIPAPIPVDEMFDDVTRQLA